MKVSLRLGLFGSILALLFGCQKVYDYIKDYPATDNKDCAITRIAVQDFYATTLGDTLWITYNTAGNPVKITRPSPSTAKPNFIFLYKNGRLTDFMGVYRDESVTYHWHRYQYDHKGRIVVDSIYIFALRVNDQPTDYYDSRRSDIQYDDKDRIIRETITYYGNIYMQTDYTYDQNGNRVGRTYDNKMSLLRTNKIWMFLNRDYSVNNPFRADTYNSHGLPLKVNSLEGTYNFMEGDEIWTKFDITYQCR